MSQPESATNHGHSALRVLPPLVLASFLLVGQLYAALPLIPSMIDRFHVSGGSAAWLATAFGLAYAVAQIATGPLTDRIGQRRAVMIGIAATAVLTIAIPFSPNFAVLVGLRVAQGLAAAVFAPAALAFFTHRVRPGHRTIALSVFVSSLLASAILAPLLVTWLVAAYAWQTWFVVSAIALALVAQLTFLAMGKDVHLDAGAAQRQAILKPLLRVLSHGRLVLVYFSAFAVMAGFIGISTGLQLAGPGLAGEPGALSLARLFTLSACVVIPALAAPLGRITARRRAIVGIVIGAVALAAITLPWGVWWITAVWVIVTAAVAIALPGIIATIGQLGAAYGGTAAGMYGVALFLGASVGPQIATITLPAGFITIGIVLAAIMLCGGLATIAATRPRQRPTEAIE
jgi:predicted MFS family arabinose efflux permease